MQTVGALPPGNAFPAPHKPECAKLRKNKDRFARLPGSNPNRFADLPADDDASIAWHPKRFAPMQRHGIDRIRIACQEGAMTTGCAPLPANAIGRRGDECDTPRPLHQERPATRTTGEMPVGVARCPAACGHADIPQACPPSRVASPAAAPPWRHRIVRGCFVR
jgi:hypothetical protein